MRTLEQNKRMSHKIQDNNSSVEWPSTRQRFHAFTEALDEPTISFPLNCAFLQEPITSHADPSLWSLSSTKRCVDLLFAIAALLLLWPLLLVAATLIHYESPGPVIFRQKRVGRHGALFTIFKFRTMAIAGRKEGPSLTRRGDPRVTRIGRFLRKSKLDELPQLFNVLRGQMSLIGPRPKLPHLDVMRMPFRPGLTGAATLVFRREEEMLQDVPDDDLEAYYCSMIKPLKANIDWDYMRQATLMSDLALLFETARCCVSTKSSSWAVDFSESAKSVSRCGPRYIPED
jgi:lipopolysaccharide/colanic/teichoic acid biosynthesis glycosyltransferase